MTHNHFVGAQHRFIVRVDVSQAPVPHRPSR